MSSTSDASASPSASLRFDQLGLPAPLLAALSAVGYESPSPIQAATIPELLAGRDVLGQAQTGTGKTAAFALPLLARIDLARAEPQALVLTPTRELALQVAEAFMRYAAQLPGFHVLPIYGGQGYGPQLHALKRGTHVVVGTPGRVIDHLERGTLKLGALRMLVLDEADEMLRMGFIDDVETVLAKSPPTRQVALFSATMPPAIARIARTHLREPVEVTIAAPTRTASRVHQRYWLVSGVHKLDALTRILEVEPFDGLIVFARTKQATEELAGKLEARGFAAAALNGDVPQPMRERIVQRFKDGELDILVATDVAARGLDVERVSHVVNYDIPTDTESYVHRIGRTGRAGRSGEAILFVTPRERHLLRAIERATRQPIEVMGLPGAAAINDRRIDRFMQRITAARELNDIAPYRQLIERYEQMHGVPAVDIAAALARMVQGKHPLLLNPADDPPPAAAPSAARERSEGKREPARERAPITTPRPPRAAGETPALALWRIAVGRDHGAEVRQIVGAIANEAGLERAEIGRIVLRGPCSFVELPADLDPERQSVLQRTRVAGRPLRLERADATAEADAARPPRAPRTPFASEAAHGADRPGSAKRGAKPAGFKQPAARKSAAGKPGFTSAGRKPAATKAPRKPAR
jgi:ATP-dependent RNA helicase DeaD